MWVCWWCSFPLQTNVFLNFFFNTADHEEQIRGWISVILSWLISLHLLHAHVCIQVLSEHWNIYINKGLLALNNHDELDLGFKKNLNEYTQKSPVKFLPYALLNDVADSSIGAPLGWDLISPHRAALSSKTSLRASDPSAEIWVPLTGGWYRCNLSLMLSPSSREEGKDGVRSSSAGIWEKCLFLSTSGSVISGLVSERGTERAFNKQPWHSLLNDGIYIKVGSVIGLFQRLNFSRIGYKRPSLWLPGAYSGGFFLSRLVFYTVVCSVFAALFWQTPGLHN